MTESLDLSAPLAPPVTATVTADAGIQLAPPAPVPVIQEEQAAGMIPLDDATKRDIDVKARAFHRQHCGHG